MPIVWNKRLDTGIEVIDAQHRQIVAYINDLEVAKTKQDKRLVTDVIEQLIDYTQSHFGFEEALLEEAGYKLLKPHREGHELFIKRVAEFTMRAVKGEEITEELHSMLSEWLLKHIANDDRDYVEVVKQMVGAPLGHGAATGAKLVSQGYVSELLGQFFR